MWTWLFFFVPHHPEGSLLLLICSCPALCSKCFTPGLASSTLPARSLLLVLAGMEVVGLGVWWSSLSELFCCHDLDRHG